MRAVAVLDLRFKVSEVDADPGLGIEPVTSVTVHQQPGSAQLGLKLLAQAMDQAVQRLGRQRTIVIGPKQGEEGVTGDRIFVADRQDREQGLGFAVAGRGHGARGFQQRKTAQ